MNEQARRHLAEYLRFQRALGIDAVRIAMPLMRADLPPAMTARQGTPDRFDATSSRPTSEMRSANAIEPAREPQVAPAPARAPLPQGQAGGELLVIREDLGDCKRCKLHVGRHHIVYGSGSPDAELVFVGEGPGADEDEQGMPFVGRAGQLLTDMIQKGMGLRREDVYICNVVKCRPPSNRTPETDECAACTPFLFRQLAAIRPRVVCALGATAAQNLLGRKSALGPLRGHAHPLQLGSGATQLVVTYHPAYLLRDPSQKREAWKDLQFVMQLLRAGK